MNPGKNQSDFCHSGARPGVNAPNQAAQARIGHMIKIDMPPGQPNLRHFCAILALWLAAACGGRQAPPPPGPEIPERVVLHFVTTNDVHGHIRHFPLFAAQVQHLREQSRANPASSVVLLDAGDMFQGTLETNLSQGASMIELYNLLGYDAATIGNHEFDYGEADSSSVAMAGQVADGLDRHPQGALRMRLEEANFPIVNTNLVDRATGELPGWQNLKRSVLFERAGVKIGVVGGLTEETPHVVKQRLLGGLSVTEPARAVAAEAARLRGRGAELVVALVHLGGECERFDDPHDLSSCDSDSELFRFARALPKGSVDIIFGGHRHRAVAHYVAGIPVAHAYWAGRAFSRIDVELDRKRGERHFKLFPPHEICDDNQEPCVTTSTDGTRLQPIAAYVERTNQLIERMRQVRSRLIGASCDEPLPRDNTAETALGNLFVDLMLKALPGADVAIANAGSIRASLPAGELTYGSIYEAMPFDNQLSSAEVTGEELRTLLRRHVRNQEHGPASIAGLRVRASCEAGALKLLLTRNDGTPIRDSDRLTLVTSDFVATGGDDLIEGPLAARFEVHPGKSVRGVLIEGLKELRRIRAGSTTLHDPQNPRMRIDDDVPSCNADQLDSHASD